MSALATVPLIIEAINALPMVESEVQQIIAAATAKTTTLAQLQADDATMDSTLKQAQAAIDGTAPATP